MASPERDISRDADAVVEAAVQARSWAAARSRSFRQRLATLVSIDTGADSPDGRDQAAGLLAEWAAACGCRTELVPKEAGLHLICRLSGEGSGRIVLLGHHDTVFPAGTAVARPFEVRDEVAYGPGVADMKGGLLVGLQAIEALAQGGRPFASVELHSVPDEEIRTVPFATLDRVRGADVVLVLECGRENGDLVSGRKTGAWIRLTVEGRPAHAGTEPERGRSAVKGLAHEIIRVEALNGQRPGLTVIAGTVTGGTLANVVPECAETMLDVRAPLRADFDWAVAEIARVGSYDGLRVRVEDAGTWPGIEQGPAGIVLLAESRRLAAELGEPLDGQTSGGMSDGCWTADIGIPTLDGFGPVGGDDHSPAEYARLGTVPGRCGLLAGLCEAAGRGLLAAAGNVEGVNAEG
jgi:glutamate carboxypeptidase